jgi:hypothetical protein
LIAQSTLMHGEDCAKGEASPAMNNRQTMSNFQIRPYASTGDACAHGRTLFHNVK